MSSVTFLKKRAKNIKNNDVCRCIFLNTGQLFSSHCLQWDLYNSSPIRQDLLLVARERLRGNICHLNILLTHINFKVSGDEHFLTV